MSSEDSVRLQYKKIGDRSGSLSPSAESGAFIYNLYSQNKLFKWICYLNEYVI